MPSPLCPPLSAHNPRSVFVSVCSCMCVWRAGEDTHCYIPLTIPPSLSPLWDLFHYFLAPLPPSEIFSLLFTRLFDSLALSLSPVCLRSSSLMKSHLSHFFSWLLQAEQKPEKQGGKRVPVLEPMSVRYNAPALALAPHLMSTYVVMQQHSRLLPSQTAVPRREGGARVVRGFVLGGGEGGWVGLGGGEGECFITESGARQGSLHPLSTSSGISVPPPTFHRSVCTQGSLFPLTHTHTHRKRKPAAFKQSLICCQHRASH